VLATLIRARYIRRMKTLSVLLPFAMAAGLAAQANPPQQQPRPRRDLLATDPRDVLGD
jgi:hypothetical protein